MIDEPLQYFFATSFTQAKPLSSSVSAVGEVQSFLDAFVGDLKVHMFPSAAKNTILVRLENIADLFDGAPSTTPMFDLQGYLEAFYSQMNLGKTATAVTITERTLGNSIDYSQMQRFPWKVREEEVIDYAKPVDQEDFKVALEP